MVRLLRHRVLRHSERPGSSSKRSPAELLELIPRHHLPRRKIRSALTTAGPQWSREAKPIDGSGVASTAHSCGRGAPNARTEGQPSEPRGTALITAPAGGSTRPHR